MTVNRHGLARSIPERIKREIRKRSKFGCVICRDGFYTYEHIDPTFENAVEHNPDNMCCLCESCHGKVTRGIWSKERVRNAYQNVQSDSGISPPKGVLDFHNGNVQLQLGDLIYTQSVRTILRYYGEDVIRVDPGDGDEPGRITAIFTDENGIPTLYLSGNEWEGSLDSWDITTTGPRITVRRKAREIALQLRLDPPGKIVIERLDMRIGDFHILATDRAYTVGYYISSEEIFWLRATFMLIGGNPEGAAIEIVEPALLANRCESYKDKTTNLSTTDEMIVINAYVGVAFKPLGLVFASQCGGYGLSGYALGRCRLDEIRRAILSDPDNLLHFIAYQGKRSRPPN